MITNGVRGGQFDPRVTKTTRKLRIAVKRSKTVVGMNSKNVPRLENANVIIRSTFQVSTSFPHRTTTDERYKF